MTERKVLNKYFPPDFDPAKIPRLKGKKKEKIFSIRTMAPFNMMCLTCRGYIFKAKKFNSRMEESGDTYLELKEYRFYIRCPTCCAEIIYQTDREHNDYTVISGAKRSFEAYTTAIRQAIKEDAAEKEELEKNPIKALEKRTEESMNEFKMNNKIQDLMEKSRRMGSREIMLDEAMEMLRKEREAVEVAKKQNIYEEAQKMVQLQKQVEADREKETQMRLDEVDTMMLNVGSENENIAKLRAMMKRKKDKEETEMGDAKKPRTEQCTESPSTSRDCVKDQTEITTESETTENLLGIYYESD